LACPSPDWGGPNRPQGSANQVGKTELGLKFNPQCQLPDAVSSGVTQASGLNLSECADYLAVRKSLSFGQIVARIIEVWVVQDICKASLELQCDPFRQPEALAKAEVPSGSPRANERPYTCVAKAANDLRATKEVVG
jgi:hypothetical protein